PATDDVPASDVEHHGFEAEVIVFSTFLQVCPRRPQHIRPVEVQQIPLGEQPLSLWNPGKDLAELEVGLVEIETDVIKPLAYADGGQSQAAAATTQRHRDHAHVHPVRQDVAHQWMGNVVHQGVVALYHRGVTGLFELVAPPEDRQHALEFL